MSHIHSACVVARWYELRLALYDGHSLKSSAQPNYGPQSEFMLSPALAAAGSLIVECARKHLAWAIPWTSTQLITAESDNCPPYKFDYHHQGLCIPSDAAKMTAARHSRCCHAPGLDPMLSTGQAAPGSSLPLRLPCISSSVCYCNVPERL